MVTTIAACSNCGKELVWRVGEKETLWDVTLKEGTVDICKECNRAEEIEPHGWSFCSKKCLVAFFMSSARK